MHTKAQRDVGHSCKVQADFIRWRGVLFGFELAASVLPSLPNTHPSWSRDWDVPPSPLPLLQPAGVPSGCWGLCNAAFPRRDISLTLEGCRRIPWAEQARAEGPPLPSPHRNSWKPPKIDSLVENSPSSLTSFLPAWQPGRTSQPVIPPIQAQQGPTAQPKLPSHSRAWGR